MRVTYTFQELKSYARKRVKCSVCGKSVTRQRKFWATQNPFNKNATGEPKSSKEIYADLSVQAKAWQQEPEKCSSCSESGE